MSEPVQDPALPTGPAWLFCPADRPERFDKAAAAADVVILDLEDGVGADRRPAARDALRSAAAQLDPARTVVRISAVGTAEHTADMALLAELPVRWVMLAKTESATDLRALGGYRVIALCETPRGILNAAEIAAADGCAALMWGAEDLVSAIGGSSSRLPDGGYRDVARHARQAVLIAAAAAGRPALDAVYTALADSDGLAAEARDAAGSGFAAKVCLHPRQVPVVRAAFRPAEAEIERAERIVAAAQANGGNGAFALDGQMVDEPVVRQAHRIVARAAAIPASIPASIPAADSADSADPADSADRPERPERVVARRGATALIERDLASVWHPFTQHALWHGDEPLVIDRAAGRHLYDVDGRAYLDGVSSLWVTVHGHCEPAINDAITAQLERLDHSTFLGLTHEPGIALAEELLRVAPPGLAKVFYAGDGSSAAEAAIKMAYQAASQRGEDRPIYVHIAEGYHGDTLGAVSLGGVSLFHDTYRPLLIDTQLVSSPGVLAPGQTRADRAGEVLTELAGVLDRHAGRVCAIVVEPLVQAAGGMLTHDAEFLRGARKLCDRDGAALVVDEVATGIGATGAWFAVEHAGVTPDLMVVGKRMTGGTMPLSAVLATQAIYDAFLGEPTRTFFHGHTYTANPLACAAALANLALMHERSTVARAAAVGERMGAALASIGAYDGVREVRRLGTMTGVEVHPSGQRTGARICREARRHGVIVRPLGDVVVLMPPLGITDAELDELTGVVDASIRTVVQ